MHILYIYIYILINYLVKYLKGWPFPNTYGENIIKNGKQSIFKKYKTRRSIFFTRVSFVISYVSLLPSSAWFRYSNPFGLSRL